MFLFSYGSNHPTQLRDRAGTKNVLNIYPAYVEGYYRAFRGFSKNWGGGIATLIKHKDSMVYGYVAELTKDGLDNVSQYEGSSYKLETLKIKGTSVTDTAKAFIMKSGYEYNEPSKKYLNAIAKTISTFWMNNDGSKITADDIIYTR